MSKSEAVEEILARAVRLHQSGQIGDAIRSYRKIVKKAPRHAGALNLLGLACFQAGELADAASHLSQAIALKPDLPNVHFNLARVLQSLGRNQEASERYREAIRRKPDDAEAQNNLASVLRLLGRVEESLPHYESALALRPAYAEAHLNFGNALLALGRRDEASLQYQQALAVNPRIAEAHRMLGGLLLATGRNEEALRHHQQALALTPNDPLMHCHVGHALRALGRHEGALASYWRATELKPDLAEAHLDIGVCLLEMGHGEEAILAFEKAIEVAGDLAEAHFKLADALRAHPAVALLAVHRRERAVDHYRKATELLPDHADTHFRLGNALFDLGRFAEAAEAYRGALKCRADFAEAALRLGNAQRALGQYEDSMASYDRVTALRPDVAEALHNKGNILVSLGRLAEGRALFDKALQLAPRDTVNLYSVASSRRFASGDPLIASMEDMLRDASLPADDRIRIHFTLGKVYADFDDHARSFEHLLAGNALRRRQVTYDEPAMMQRFENIRSVFTAEFVRDHPGVGDPSPLPIFIIGMPRSGTTLVEQILASHPGVAGAGEIDEFGRAVREVARRDAVPARFPELVRLLSGEQFSGIGRRYIEALHALAPDVDRVTDKLPGNFHYAGLIHLALPHAKLIHTKRDPLDTCLSCFSRLFTQGQNFSYDLGELGRYYRAYDALMEHWRQVLPAGVMLEVRYEELVADLEGEARRIVAHAGLDWDDRCLEFHRTARPVRTASATQVRQPIYRDAVGRWRPYRDQLAPLLETLGVE